MSDRRSTRLGVERVTRRRRGGHHANAVQGDSAPKAELLVALHENQRLLRELAYAYRMPRVEARVPGSQTSVPIILNPHDIVKLLGEEMNTLCQEQLRVVLLVMLRGIQAL